MIMGRRMSACCGRSCRPQIGTISDYSILGRDCRLSVARRNKRFHTAPLQIGSGNLGHGMIEFHREIGFCILFVNVAQGCAQQSDVKVALRHHTNSYVLHASCRHPRNKFLTVTSPADEIFVNAVSHPLVHYSIYLRGGPVIYSYGGQFLAIKLAVYGHAI